MRRRHLLALGLSALALAGCKQESSVTEELDRLNADEASKQEQERKMVQEFLDANKAIEGVTVTASGLQWRVLTAGSGGPKPTARSTVRVHYEGKLVNGSIFDSSYKRGQPADFPVGQLIPAWVEALQLMSEGDVFEIVVPPEIGYGARGAPPSIPGNSVLIFKMELIKILR